MQGSAITDPTPVLVVGDKTVNISAMMDGLDTSTWKTTTKTSTIFHTREYFTGTQEPAGYVDDWFDATPDDGEGPAWQTETVTFTFTGDGSLNYDLLGDQWQNVTLTVSGNGDFDMPTKPNEENEGNEGKEVVTLTGDIGGLDSVSYSNPQDKNGEKDIDFVSFGPEGLNPTVDQYGEDGSINIGIDFSQPVSSGTVWIVLTYEFA